MSAQTFDYKLVLDMHPKTKVIDPRFRSKAAKDLRVVFSGMYPKVRLVYHRPPAFGNRSEHIFVVFDCAHSKLLFCTRRNVHNPLRLVYNYNGGPIELFGSVPQEIQWALDDINEAAVVFRGPLFDQVGHESIQELGENGYLKAEGTEEFYQSLLQSEVEYKGLCEDSEPKVDGVVNQLKRLESRLDEKILKNACYLNKIRKELTNLQRYKEQKQE